MPGQEIKELLGRSISSAKRAEWGFQNRTDLVTLRTGERVVVQRYRRREDAEYRVRAMQALHGPAASSGIAIPHVRDALTGLLDFESVRLADPLFDVAWWCWSVSFGAAGCAGFCLPGVPGGGGSRR